MCANKVNRVRFDFMMTLNMIMIQDHGKYQCVIIHVSISITTVALQYFSVGISMVNFQVNKNGCSGRCRKLAVWIHEGEWVHGLFITMYLIIQM